MPISSAAASATAVCACPRVAPVPSRSREETPGLDLLQVGDGHLGEELSGAGAGQLRAVVERWQQQRHDSAAGQLTRSSRPALTWASTRGGTVPTVSHWPVGTGKIHLVEASPTS